LLSPPRIGAPKARARKAPLAARLTLAIVGLALAFAALEATALLGLVDYRRALSTTDDPRLNPDNVPDPERSYRHRPEIHRAGATYGNVASAWRIPGARPHPFDVRYDCRGFRNPTDLEHAEVAVVGDSFVEGGLVAADELLTAELSRLAGVTVANLGQCGYGPREELAVVRSVALPLRPRLVVWTFFEGNDLHDLRRPASPGLDPFAERSFGRNLARALGRFVTVAPDPRASSWFGRVAGTRVYFPEPAQPLSPGDLDALSRLRGILEESRAECRRGGADLLIVFVPTSFRVLEPLCRFGGDSPCLSWSPSDLPDRLRDLVAGLGPGVDYLDLTPSLRRAAEAGPLPYFDDDTHWTPAGHRAAAHAIAGRLGPDGSLRR
jgi:hypothetical protein